MPHLRPIFSQGNDANSQLLGNLTKIINQHNITGDDNITIQQTSHGKHISVNIPQQQSPMVFVGNWNPSSSYSINQAVYVDSTLSYTYSGSALPFSSPGFTAGLYICTNFVPSSDSTSDVLVNYVAPALPTGPNASTINDYRWYKYNVYYPTVPNNTATPTLIYDSVTGYPVMSSQSYWQQLGGGGSSVITSSIQNSQFVCTGQDGGDYILAKSLPNGGTVAQALASSASYYIAKPYKIRNSITTEYINGVTHSYTYSPPLNDSASYYTRNDVYGSLSEQQTITPQYLIGDIIVAAPVNGTIPGYISVIVTGSITNGGESYTVGDYLYPVIGALGVYPATMSVTSVGVSGSLTSFAIVNCGKYTYATNPLPTLPTTNGSGFSASINLIYSSPLEDLNVDGRAWGH